MSAQLLIEAAESGNTDVVESLLADSTDVNAPLNGGETALIRAASNGHAETVRMLLAKGADVNARPANGMTALIRAAFFGHAEVVAALLARGADTDAQDPLGQTALKWATAKGHTEVVKLLKNTSLPVVEAAPPVVKFTAPVPAPPPIHSLTPAVVLPVADEDEVTKISARRIAVADDDAAAGRVKHQIPVPIFPPPAARPIVVAPVTDGADDYSASFSGRSLRRLALGVFAAALIFSFVATAAFYVFSSAEQPAVADAPAAEQPASASPAPSVSQPTPRRGAKDSSATTSASDRNAVRGGESTSPNRTRPKADIPAPPSKMPAILPIGDAAATDSAKAAKSAGPKEPKPSPQNTATGDDAGATPPQSAPRRRVASSSSSPTPASSSSPAPKKKVIQWP